MTAPDRSVEDAHHWLNGLSPKVKAVSSHWCFHPATFTPRKNDHYICSYRPMEDVVMSMYDYIRGDDWMGRLTPKQAIEHAELTFHWSWHSLVIGMIESKTFEMFLWSRKMVGIPDLTTQEARSTKYDWVMSLDDGRGLEGLEKILLRKIHVLDIALNPSPNTAWRQQYRSRVKHLIRRRKALDKPR